MPSLPEPSNPSQESGLTGASPPAVAVSSGLGPMAPSATSSGLGPVRPVPREQFEAGELAVVCSRYDIGVIESVKEFRRGSGRAPKVVIKTGRGLYLLKRRAAGRDAPARVAFCHEIQRHLAARRFPLPKLVSTKTEGGSMLELDGRIYELFEYVQGNSFDQSLDATFDAGRALAFFHRLLGGYQSRRFTPVRASYHGARALEEHLAMIASRLGVDAGGLVRRLGDAYADAAARVDRLGFAGWPLQIVHGDWHPGNMVFRGSRVAAVIDYDTARLSARVIDIANGALQFSITMQGDDPSRWPLTLDEGRLKRFFRGYENVRGSVISTAELDAVPWLMIEALVVEAALPIAATGSFAGLDGAAFLRMVDGKVAWIRQNAARLTSLIAD